MIYLIVLENVKEENNNKKLNKKINKLLYTYIWYIKINPDHEGNIYFCSFI